MNQDQNVILKRFFASPIETTDIPTPTELPMCFPLPKPPDLVSHPIYLPPPTYLTSPAASAPKLPNLPITGRHDGGTSNTPTSPSTTPHLILLKIEIMAAISKTLSIYLEEWQFFVVSPLSLVFQI